MVITTKIRGIVLEVTAQNDKALWFRGLPRTQLSHKSWLCVQGDFTFVKKYSKYLALTLVARLNFDAHLSCILPWVEIVAILLGRLLLNLMMVFASTYMSRDIWPSTWPPFGLSTYQILEYNPAMCSNAHVNPDSKSIPDYPLWSGTDFDRNEFFPTDYRSRHRTLHLYSRRALWRSGYQQRSN